MITPEMLTEGLKLLAVVAAAWGSVKTSLNGARADIASIKVTVGKIDEKVGAHGERLARLEAHEEARE